MPDSKPEWCLQTRSETDSKIITERLLTDEEFRSAIKEAPASTQVRYMHLNSRYIDRFRAIGRDDAKLAYPPSGKLYLDMGWIKISDLQK